MPSLRVPVLAPMTVAETSGASCTKPSMLPTITFPTLSLSLTNWSLPMEQESTSPVIRTAAVNCGHGCLLQCFSLLTAPIWIIYFCSLSTTLAHLSCLTSLLPWQQLPVLAILVTFLGKWLLQWVSVQICTRTNLSKTLAVAYIHTHVRTCIGNRNNTNNAESKHRVVRPCVSKLCTWL